MNSKKTWILTFLCLFTCLVIWGQTPPKIRRICKGGADNNLYFFPTQDTCSKFYKYYVWVRNGNSGPFVLLDSISNPSASQYTHTNANPGTTNPKWYYYIESVDSCPPDYNIYSDTETVDDLAPDTVYIDSASIDINTNQVHIGWRFNRSPDFYLFKLVTKISGIYTDLTNGGTRDTSWIDTNPASNPSLRPIFYDLTSRDSCNNEQVFNINPHQTIFLQSKIDTCKKQVTLNWSAYMGWKTRKHYLYIKTGATFVELDSVDGNTFTYTLPVPLGQTIYYYVRAFRDTTAGTYSSASNVTSVTSRNRIDPQNLYLSDVTNNAAEHLEVSFILGSGEEARDFNIRRALRSNASYSIVATIPSDYSLAYSWEDLSAINTTIYLYQITAINLCGQETALSNISNNIVLAVDGSEVSNTLSWNKYFKWDTTVQLYRIYRANVFSNQPKTYTLLATAPDKDSMYVDDALPAEVGDQGICYYVEAIQSDGSPHGIKAISTSNQACAIGNMIVWVPNAFHPDGVNKTFKPGGSYIDFVNSSLEIYDRWGALIIKFSDLSNGWDGSDQSNKPCPIGVYLYKMRIKGFDGKEQVKTGLVNLLR